MNNQYIRAKNFWVANKNKSIFEVSKIFNIDRQSFSSFLKEEGVWEDRRKKYKINNNFFSEINSPTKSYLLGFIAADGCIITNSNKTLKGLDISLQKKDELFLRKINSLMDGSPERIKEKSKSFSLRIVSVDLARQLFSLGITPNKSLTLDLSKIEVPQQYLKDFIRGYFDGDGCFFYKEYSYNKQCLISFTGTLESIHFIRNILMKECHCSLGTITKRNNNNSNNYTIQWQGCNQNKNIVQYLLSTNSEITLERKTQDMLKFLNMSNV